MIENLYKDMLINMMELSISDIKNNHTLKAGRDAIKARMKKETGRAGVFGRVAYGYILYQIKDAGFQNEIIAILQSKIDKLEAGDVE